jgi:hypothetical protein
MDIAGEVTDISLAKDHILLESVSFPMGKNMLIRALAQGMKTTPALAVSELHLYVENKATPEHVKQIEEILEGATKEWLELFENALAQFAVEFPIPQTIFYTADDNIARWFDAAIQKTNFAKFSQEDGTFVVRSLGNAFLGKFIQILEPDFQDPFLAIETIFAKKFLELKNKKH